VCRRRFHCSPTGLLSRRLPLVFFRRFSSLQGCWEGITIIYVLTAFFCPGVCLCVVPLKPLGLSTPGKTLVLTFFVCLLSFWSLFLAMFFRGCRCVRWPTFEPWCMHIRLFLLPVVPPSTVGRWFLCFCGPASIYCRPPLPVFAVPSETSPDDRWASFYDCSSSLILFVPVSPEAVLFAFGVGGAWRSSVWVDQLLFCIPVSWHFKGYFPLFFFPLRMSPCVNSDTFSVSDNCSAPKAVLRCTDHPLTKTHS